MKQTVLTLSVGDAPTYSVIEHSASLRLESCRYASEDVAEVPNPE